MMDRNQPLKDKVAVVTGAAAGIGRGSAQVLAQCGGRVVVADIDDKGGAETVALITNAGGRASFCRADVTRADQIAALVAYAEKTYGGLDIMHANAGITDYAELEVTTETQMDRVLDLNLRGVLLCARYAIPAMKKRGGGSIVFTSSVLNTIGFPGCVVYSATKAGMIGAARTLAVEVGKHNIRVNCVSPGTINTPMLARDVTDLPAMRAANALGRIGEPEDIGEAVAWLSSDAAGYVTGQNLYVDGAFTALKKI